MKIERGLLSERTERLRFDATYAEVVEHWRDDAGFRGVFAEALRQCPWEAFFFETPPVRVDTADQPFECVLVDAPSFRTRSPNPAPFSAHFSDAPVATFPNLAGDAMLVVPCPRVAPEVYLHLAAFLRGAPDDQVDALWAAVGAAVTERLSTRSMWLSTAGLGVFWLHMRLDPRPKYYKHAPYRRIDGIDRQRG